MIGTIGAIGLISLIAKPSVTSIPRRENGRYREGKTDHADSSVITYVR